MSRIRIQGLGAALIRDDAAPAHIIERARRMVDALASAHALERGGAVIWWHDHVGWRETRDVLLAPVGAADLIGDYEADARVALSLAYSALLPLAQDHADEIVLLWARSITYGTRKETSDA